jgi:4-hydroxy-tetrahydrodipicolinate reductase
MLEGTTDMHTMLILGDGPLGRAVETAVRERHADDGARARLLGRPAGGRHAPADLAGAQVVVEASRPDAVAANLLAALEAGCRRFVIATTGWTDDRPRVEGLLEAYGASAVAAPNFSLGVVLFGRLVETAVELYGQVEAFDPYLVEWHRRSKRDRPSGTAADLARRIAARHPRLDGPADLEVVSVRAGASPGMHLVGFDAAGETVELRLTARDRSAYAAGILAAADWLERAPHAPAIHSFETVVDALIARHPIAA